MIESYAFFVMFVVQVLVMSVLLPIRIIRSARTKAKQFPAERFAQAHPGVDWHKTFERHITRFRVLNVVAALLGLLLLGWLANYMTRPDWDDGPVEALVAAYFGAQAFPLFFLIYIGFRYGKLLRSLLEQKRTAVLKRRGLFDFVSPFTVGIAILCYFLFVAYVIFISQSPFPGFAGPYINIGIITLGYAALAFFVYRTLYGRSGNPLETHADRLYAMGVSVRVCVYSAIAVVVNLSINFTLVLLDMQRWEPFAGSAALVFNAFLCFMAFARPRPWLKADGMGASPVS